MNQGEGEGWHFIYILHTVRMYVRRYVRKYTSEVTYTVAQKMLRLRESWITQGPLYTYVHKHILYIQTHRVAPTYKKLCIHTYVHLCSSVYTYVIRNVPRVK